MNRRTKKYFRLGLLAAFLLFSVVYTALSGSSPDTDYSLSIIILTIALVLCAGYVICQIPAVKGVIGERWIVFFIKLGKGKEDVLINDVIVPGEDGKTSQIDHILVSTKGVYVVETKNISGQIYGNNDEKQWMQVLNYGKVKNQFYSPLKQNETHIYRLQNIIGQFPVNNCVVFAQGNTYYIKADVYYPYSLYKKIKLAPTTALAQEKVKEISDKILEYKKNPIQTNKEHIQEIHATQDAIKNNICPRCGGKLVLRHSHDSRAFYGCENYPKCKFTKNI